MATFNIISNTITNRNDNPTFSVSGADVQSVVWYYRTNDMVQHPLVEELFDENGSKLITEAPESQTLLAFLSSTISGNTHSLTYQFSESEVPLKQWYEIGYKLNHSSTITWSSKQLYIYQAPSIPNPIISLETELHPRTASDLTKYQKYYTFGNLQFSWNYPSKTTLPSGWNLQYQIKYVVGSGSSYINYGSGTVGSSGGVQLPHLTLGTPGNAIKFYVAITSTDDPYLNLSSLVSNSLTMLQDFTYEGGAANMNFSTEDYGTKARAGVDLRPNYYHRYVNSSSQHPAGRMAITVNSEHPRYAESELGYKDFNYVIYLRKPGTSTDIQLVNGQITDNNVSRITDLLVKYSENLDPKLQDLFGTAQDKLYTTTLVLEFIDIYGRRQKQEKIITIDFREAPFEVSASLIKFGRNPVKNDANHIASSTLQYFPPSSGYTTNQRLIISDEYFLIGFQQQSLASYSGDTKVNRQYNLRILSCATENGEYQILSQIKNLTTANFQPASNYNISDTNTLIYPIKATNLTNGYYYKVEIQVQDAYDPSYSDISSVYTRNTSVALIGYNVGDITVQLSSPTLEIQDSNKKCIANFSNKITLSFPSIENNTNKGYEREISGYSPYIELVPQFSIDMVNWTSTTAQTASSNYYNISLPSTREYSYQAKPSMLYTRIQLTYNRRLEVKNDASTTSTEQTIVYSNIAVSYLNIATVAYRQNELGINTTTDLTGENVIVIKDHEAHKNLILQGTNTDSTITKITYNIGTGELISIGTTKLFASNTDIDNIFN